jgi:hypothetical protein
LRIILLFLFLASCNYGGSDYAAKQQYLNNLKKVLENRLKSSYNKEILLPEIIPDDSITSNAVWDGKKIKVGNMVFKSDFLTYEDKLSIIFHEYTHFKFSGKNIYSCKIDSNGKIYQVYTDTLIVKIPSPIDTSEIFYPKNILPETERIMLSNEAKKNTLIRFIYAPSNLSREEILCYEAELKANQEGITNISSLYKAMIKYQINAENIKMKYREEYENKHNLLPSGEKNR